MGLRSSIVGKTEGEESYVVRVEDDLAGAVNVREVPHSRCAALAGDLLRGEVEDALFAGVARAIAVRDYLQDIGEDPDAPSLA